MKKKNKFFIRGFAIVLALTLFGLVGCSTKQKATDVGNTNISTSEGKKIITDTTGKKVELKQEIERIAVVPIPWASIVYAVDGSGERIVGMHPSAKTSYQKSILKSMAPELNEASTNFVGNDFAIHMEESGKLNLDAIIVWDYQEKEIEQLKSVGIPAVSLKYGSLEDLQNGMDVIGQLLGKEDRAKKLVDYHKESIKYFDSKKDKIQGTEKPKVLYLRDDQLKVAGAGAVNTNFIEMAGGENVAKQVSGQWVNVTMEQIMEWNPEIIIMSNFSNFKPEDIMNNKIEGQDWRNIDAVKNNKVLKAPMGIYRWDAPCAETPLMIKWIAKQLQPDVFNDFDLEKDIKSFYNEFLNHDITKEEVDSVLQKELNEK
ncbi:ABC transporter substrate-binding protein [Clostridium amazonitimonense]|uniref:ABC transporter substrate-binding protein n=1 Tax=Clostridium amazonitimonense TaxID=1499689 RepID=UPI000509E787|nr:ABC transporter substrate-binding protein [Clostridium amazonitimonense]